MSAACPEPLGVPRAASPACAEAVNRALDAAIDGLEGLRVSALEHKRRTEERGRRLRQAAEALSREVDRLIALADTALPCGLPRCAECGGKVVPHA